MRLSGAGFLLAMATFVVVALAVIGFYVANAGPPRSGQVPLEVERGDADAGRRALEAFGCGACHAIPGIRSARGRAAPDLSGLRERSFLAGRMPHTPENLVRWIMEPQSISPGSAMPNLGVPEQSARDMAAYLYQAGGTR